MAPGAGPDFERRYLAAVIEAGTGGTGTFGMRVMWPSLPELTAKLATLYPDQPTDAARMAQAFGTPLYVHLVREDLVAQAVSRLKAEQSGLWHRHADGSERERVKPHEAPRYDADRLAAFVAESEAHNRAWDDWFASQGIAPLRLTYEALADDPRAVLAEILAALGQDPAIASRGFGWHREARRRREHGVGGTLPAGTRHILRPAPSRL